MPHTFWDFLIYAIFAIVVLWALDRNLRKG